MSDGKCTKRYPRDLFAETITDNDGYPLYHRRSTENGGKSITLKVPNNDFEVDNRLGCTVFTVNLKNVQNTHQCRVLQFGEIDQVHLQICQQRKQYGWFWNWKCN